MSPSSTITGFVITALVICLEVEARPIGKYPPPEKPEKPQRPEGPVQPFSFLRAFGELRYPPVVSPAELNNGNTIFDGPLNQADYPDPADIPDAPDYDAPDSPDTPDAPDYEEYEPPDAPDAAENEGPGVFTDGGFGFLGGNQAPFMMTGGKAPSPMNKGTMTEYRKGAGSGSSVGIAFAVLAIIGCTVALGVFFLKKHRHRIPIVLLR